MKKSEISPAQKKSFVKWFWLLFTGIIGVVALIFLLISIGLVGYVPKFEELDNPKNKFATEIYSTDESIINDKIETTHKILGTFFMEGENRMNCTYADLSPNLVNALIATEDARFYSHSGIDGKSILRAVLTLGTKGGGSTVSQQTAKIFITAEQNKKKGRKAAKNIIERIWEKMNEWVIAVKIENRYTKEEIIALYFNKFDFLNNAVGVKTASQVYFNTTPDKLTVEQAALLVGMCKNPSLYNPASRREKTRERALNRRNTVLNQMEKYKFISQEECGALKEKPLELDYRATDHKEGLAPYLREYLRVRMSAKKPKRSNYADWQQKDFGQYYLDSLAWVTDPLYGFIEKYPKSDGTKYNLYSDGLKIYTTIDSRMQEYAESAVKQQLTDLQAQFFKEKKGQKNGIFPRNMKQEEIDNFINRAIKQSERYFAMKRNNYSEKEIFDTFNKEVEMKIFTWDKGNASLIDTVMSPRDSIIWAKSFARVGFMSMQPSNGHVKAYVGGPNFSFFQYDMASVGRRQVGSTVKPFLYTLAMSNGWLPCDTLLCAPYTFENVDGRGTKFTPRNGSRARLNELVTLRWGLQNSNNWVTARLMNNLSPYDLVKLMRNFGMSGKIDPVVSLCLGPCEVSVNEMVSAYTTFPNKGIKVKPIFVTRITDNKGNLIVEFNTETHEVVSEKTACKMITMMQAVVDGGTGSRVKYRYGIPSNTQIGGKTGTTNDNADGWFIAYTPQLVSGVWVGWEDRQIHFTNMAEGQGASMALPVWALYMKKVFENSKLPYSTGASFNFPKNFSVCE